MQAVVMWPEPLRAIRSQEIQIYLFSRPGSANHTAAIPLAYEFMPERSTDRPERSTRTRVPKQTKTVLFTMLYAITAYHM